MIGTTMSDNRMTELLPCRLCGSKAHMCEMESGYGTEYAICCNYKGCRLSEHPRFGHAYKTEAEAIAAWNTRTATTDTEFARAVHDGNLWRRVKGHIRCRNCGLNIESVIAIDGCNEHAIKHCPNCGKEVTR